MLNVLAFFKNLSHLEIRMSQSFLLRPLHQGLKPSKVFEHISTLMIQYSKHSLRQAQLHLLLTCSILLSSFYTLGAQAGPSPVKWTFSVEEISQEEYQLVFRADIDKTWSVYSQYIDEGGPFPTTITYETEGVNPLGDAEEFGEKKEGMDPIFEMHVIKFVDKKPYIIRQNISKADLSQVSGYLTFMTCDDTKCLPPTDIDFNFDLSKATKSVPHKEDRAQAPKSSTPQKKSSGTTELDKSPISPKKNPKSELSEDVLDQVVWTTIPQDRMPVQWSYGHIKIDEDLYYLVYKADIEHGWSVYSQFIEDGGPFPTTLYYEKEDLNIVDQSYESGAKKEGLDPIFDMHVIKFVDKKPYILAHKVAVSDIDTPLSGVLTYMTCDDEKCLPPTDQEFSFLLSQSAGSIPTQVPQSSVISGNVIDQARPALMETYDSPLGDCGTTPPRDNSLWMLFFFGFIGGLLALLTPCVFPMIPLTVSFFTKDTKRKGWVNGLIYGLSIVFIYVSIGLSITAIFGTEALNSLSTNWIANTLFFLIFVFFAFSFFGFYDITLPSSWSTKSDQMADKGGLLGIFFMAFTLALVSFSCTGPIIGAALVESASNQVGPFVVMMGFSLALALPFGLFAAFPAWLNTLPQSGGWMNSVKVVLGFIELALAFKFLTVADLTSHWGLLKYEVFLGIWILIALGMAAYGFGWLKFPHDSPIKKISPRRWVFSLGSLALAAYLATGFIYDNQSKSYQTLPLLSGLAPPVNYNLFLSAPDVNDDIKTKYPSFGKCANNIDCFKDYYEGLAYAQETKKLILLDHTGHGCVNCRRTEDNIWSDDRIRTMLNEDYVLISLYVDDRKALEEIMISKYTSKKLRTVGSRWADFEIANFRQFSQPLYVVVTPDEQVVSAPRGYKEGIDDYYNYLKCGLDFFKAVSVSE